METYETLENIYVAVLLQIKANFCHFWPTSALAVLAFFKKRIVNMKASPLVQFQIFFCLKYSAAGFSAE